MSEGYRGTVARKGDWNVICDLSGFKCKASETVLRWDGLRVLRRFSEERQPQDFVRGVKDDPSLPWARPDQEPEFLTPGQVKPEDL